MFQIFKAVNFLKNLLITFSRCCYAKYKILGSLIRLILFRLCWHIQFLGWEWMCNASLSDQLLFNPFLIINSYIFSNIPRRRWKSKNCIPPLSRTSPNNTISLPDGGERVRLAVVWCQSRTDIRARSEKSFVGATSHGARSCSRCRLDFESSELSV